MEIKKINADKFKQKKENIYVFPFKVLDDTPNGRNLGRIEWHIEAIKSKKTKGRYFIEKLLVYPSQTYDKLYYKKPIFEIPCYSESIYSSPLNKENCSPFITNVWRILFCEVHKGIVMSAYPKDNHSELVIDVNSSISIEIYFR